MKKVFIDGKEGTTGLKIFERFQQRNDVELLLIDDEKRKDVAERKRLINQSDVTILCLPDAAAVEAAALVENPNVKLIDCSTAHRTNLSWVYGFPELVGRDKVAVADRIATPGCHASGFNAIVYPLVKLGIIGADYPLVCHSETGFSGGGKKMIAEYEALDKSLLYYGARQYALQGDHKHQPEMQYMCGLKRKPIFNPTVGNYYCGMCVSVPLYTDLLKTKTDANGIYQALKGFYDGCKLIEVKKYSDSFISSTTLSGFDNMLITVSGNEERLLLTAVFDNLGKGASGAAIQCLNLLLGADETTSLKIGDLKL